MRRSDLDDICPSIGYTATCMLQEWYAGRVLYVPTTYSLDHPLALAIGEPAFRALVRDWGGELLRVPSQFDALVLRRERRVAEMLAEGRTPSEIANEVGISVRWAQRLQYVLQERGWLEFAEFRSAGGRARQARLRPAPELRVGPGRAAPENFGNEGGFPEPSPLPDGPCAECAAAGRPD